MGIQDLQLYIQNHATGGTGVVDLLRIARNRKPQQPSRKLRLVLDAECCLDRLYGGYFSDWASGGQWNRMVQFLSILCQQMAMNGIELVVFFNGSIEQTRVGQWAATQQNTRRNVSSVLRHLSGKGTPPPKVWWVPPVCLRTCLRMALRHLNVTVVCSMDDHRQEVIAYCRENNFQGLLVEDPEYAAFDPPRYFSSEHLKLTYKGALETKEYLLARVSESLKLGTGQLAILAALLGTHLLGEDELSEFHHRVCPEHPNGKIPAEALVIGVAGFISNLGAVGNNTDQLIAQVFDGPVTGTKEAGRAARLRAAIQYYLNGTKDGFLKYKPQHKGGRNNHRGGKGKNNKTDTSKQQSPTTETLKFASETAESERDSLAAYKEATANSTQLAPEIVVEVADPSSTSHDAQHDNVTNGVVNGMSGLQLSNSSSSSNSNAASPSHSPASQSTTVEPSGDTKIWNESTTQVKTEEAESRMLGLVSPEVLRTACERHQKGLMSPNIYQILNQGEIKLNAVLEDEQHKEFPSTHHFYRPVRQMVYGVLFNLHHLTYIQTHKDDSTTANQQQQHPSPDPDSIVVKEWVWSKNNQYAKPELVKPEKLGWGVPTIQRLWFGSVHSSTIDDKRRRLRAFLSCMRSDTPLMLSPAHVPQPMLVFACVVRYMMSFPERRILRKHELDALIAQAHSPELMNATYLQDLQLPRLSSRGVQLATLVMTGVDNALLANDACGAPIPWLMCCPWLFFDGKLFQHKLLKAETCKNLVELCDHRIDEVIKVERMRQAILEGLNPQFARMPLIPCQGPSHPMRSGVPAMTMLPTSAPPLMGHQQIRGVRNQQSRPQRPVLARGGQLEIAGVVVGQWGPNYGSNLTRGTNAHLNYQGHRSYPSYGGPPAGLPQSLMNPVYGGGRSRGGVSKPGRFNNRGRGATPNRRSRGVSNHSSVPKRSSDRDTRTRGPTVSMPNGTTILASKLMNGSDKTDPMLEIGQFEDGSTNQQQTSSSSSLTPAQ